MFPARQDSFVFEVTQACNHDCLHCYNAWKNPVHYPPGQLDTRQTLAMLERMLDQTGATLVTLTGGEPLLRTDIYEIIDFLAARNVTVNLISNGRLIDAPAIERLAGKISIFELPLLSVEAAIHDRMSGRDGSFDRVTMAIAELKAARARVVSVFVATRLNLPTWHDTAQLAFALGVDGIMFNRFNPGGTGRDHVQLLQAAPDELTAALDIAQQIHDRYKLPISCSIAMPPCLFDHSRWKGLSFGFCSAGKRGAYYTLDPAGNIRPCNHSPRILGNILHQDFQQIVASPKMKDFFDARPAFCARCPLEETCLGGCKAAAEACFGDVRQCDPFLQAFASQASPPT